MDTQTGETTPLLGAHVQVNGVHFGVWAPRVDTLHVVIDDDWHLLERGENGVHTGVVSGIVAGARYRYSINGCSPLPDPRSRYQPEGVHGPSEVIHLSAYQWTDRDWAGLRNENLSIYELHVGTYTREGTFDALIGELPELRRLGVRVIELMPVADFPGRWNWGYDGVALYAPSRAYGRPEDLQRLVDAAHAEGLGVMLDVVYNHLGPDGNYLGAYSDQYFNNRHMTPWGEAVNYDGPGSRYVRDFVVDNVVQWIRDYHIDGLRLDATDLIADDSEKHILQELQERARQAVDRDIVIIAEEARNQVRTTRPVDKGGYGIDAVWADDFHHEIRVTLTNAWENYYADYVGSMDHIARALNEGFIYQGEPSKHWGGRRGTEVTDEPANAFVFCIQNHDQVGNRPFGDRLHHQIDAARYAVASALLLLAPETPLLFMGQEFAASTPFLFFTDHNDALGRLVTQGRRKEFGGFRAFEDEGAQATIPDPQAETTFSASKLDLSERERHREVHALYERLLELRHGDPVLAIQDRERSHARSLGARAIALQRWNGAEHRVLIANFGAAGRWRLADTLASGFDLDREPSIIFSTQDPVFGGENLDVTLSTTVDGPVLDGPARTAVLLAFEKTSG
jgi:maltooligosyltrehalose trehalohydrolase